MFGMVAAKSMILTEWKSPTSPCFSRWLAEIINTINLENMFLGPPISQG
jgi:hypothetical protein